MNLALSKRDILRGLSTALTDELDQLVARINFVFAKDHNPQDGSHANLRFVSTASRSIDTQLTVGAAGPAAALPATPSLYLRVTIDGTEYVCPFYVAS